MDFKNVRIFCVSRKTKDGCLNHSQISKVLLICGITTRALGRAGRLAAADRVIMFHLSTEILNLKFNVP